MATNEWCEQITLAERLRPILQWRTRSIVQTFIRGVKTICAKLKIGQSPLSSKVLGVYYRVVKNPDPAQDEQICIEYIVELDLQPFPHHKRDYAPIFFYLDKNQNITRVVYDKIHYCAATIMPSKHEKYFPVDDKSQRLKFRIINPWHAFCPLPVEEEIRLATRVDEKKYRLECLTEKRETEWQSRPEGEQFVIPPDCLENPFPLQYCFRGHHGAGAAFCNTINQIVEKPQEVRDAFLGFMRKLLPEKGILSGIRERLRPTPVSTEMLETPEIRLLLDDLPDPEKFRDSIREQMTKEQVTQEMVQMDLGREWIQAQMAPLEEEMVLLQEEWEAAQHRLEHEQGQQALEFWTGLQERLGFKGDTMAILKILVDEGFLELRGKKARLTPKGRVLLSGL